MVQMLKFGSLYLDSKPIVPEMDFQSGQSISFGDAAPDMAISWVPVNGILIADRCLLTHISWDDLDAQGLVLGKEITVQGFRFKIRLLKVGSEENTPNEWDAALDTVGEENDLWHWHGKFFWGQESVRRYASTRVYRGYSSARRWGWNGSSHRYAFLGFRPALVPLTSDPSALRLDQEVIAISRNGCVVGNLINMTQYDLLLRPKVGGATGMPSFAANMRDGTLAVDRSEILSIAAV